MIAIIPDFFPFSITNLNLYSLHTTSQGDAPVPGTFFDTSSISSASTGGRKIN
jgi:hypothetical protein